MDKGVILSNLMSLADFIRETGIHIDSFMYYRRLGRVSGLYRVCAHIVVDRSEISIEGVGSKSGNRLDMWVALGGRSGPVSVPEHVNSLLKGG